MPEVPADQQPNVTALDQILRAALTSRVYDLALETPLDAAPLLSKRVGNRVFLKREDLQPVFSFKLRGAYNRMALLNADELARGVVCASAGNHAQGVALSASHLRCRAVIVMPVTTPDIKIEAVSGLGGEVVLFGDSYDEAYAHAREIESRDGLTFVHPYDDPLVIAGQATIGLELLRQSQKPGHGRLDAVFVAVGGGGLIAGIGAVLKSLDPRIKIIGVEPEDATAMTQSLAAGHPITLDRVGRFADGVAVKRVGDGTFRIAQQVVDEMVVVSNDAICGAIKEIFEDRRAILEPAGALAYAGLCAWVAQHHAKDLNLAVIACGANVNFDTLRHVSERAELGENREAILAVTIPERPGSFREFCRAIGDRSITEFNYRYAPDAEAQVFVGIRTARGDGSAGIVHQLTQAGFAAADLSQNETAKLHIRHMVGGRAPVENERLFSFVFPERVGALARFLDSMQHPWNISLFHYRNHGSDYGRVLCGIQVPPAEEADLTTFLARLGYEWQEETENVACTRFLGYPISTS